MTAKPTAGRRPALTGALPRSGPRLKPPPWPGGDASAAELVLWRRLWLSPVAALWRAQRTDPGLVAAYVRLHDRYMTDPKPAAAGVLVRFADGLGLTPTGLARLRLRVEPDAEPTDEEPAFLAEYRAAREVES